MSAEVQVNLRLPIELKERIHNEARKNNRSLNAELGDRLQKSFVGLDDAHFDILDKLEELITRHQASNRTKNIGDKLNSLLGELFHIPSAPYLTPALIAHDLGFDRASMVEKWFQGRLEPTFAQLDMLAHFLGASPEWLSFDIGACYPTLRAPSMFSAESFVEFCFTPEESFNDVEQVLFIRNNSEAGEVLIIKQYSVRQARVFDTNIHLSHVVGATGARDQAEFVAALKNIKQSDKKLKTISYLISPDKYEKLIRGGEHPLKVIGREPVSYWADDIWDKQMYLQQKDNEYWQGWKDLCIAIDTYKGR